MFISCQRAAELASEADHRKLSRGERLRLGMHFKLCSCTICRKFSEQMKTLRRAYKDLSMRQARGELEADEAGGLCEEARDRIRRALDDSSSKSD